MKLICKECQEVLEFDEVDDGTYSVVPCIKCLEEEYDAGFDAGEEEATKLTKEE